MDIDFVVCELKEVKFGAILRKHIYTYLFRLNIPIKSRS